MTIPAVEHDGNRIDTNITARERSVTPGRGMIFGGLPVEPKEIFGLLKARLEDTARRYGRVNSSRAWTSAVKEVLEELPLRYGGRLIPGKTTAKEFMLDVAWWEQDKTGADTRAIMGVECEWIPANRLNEVYIRLSEALVLQSPSKTVDIRMLLCQARLLFLEHSEESARGDSGAIPTTRQR
jgi:hypothetical protein